VSVSEGAFSPLLFLFVDMGLWTGIFFFRKYSTFCQVKWYFLSEYSPYLVFLGFHAPDFKSLTRHCFVLCAMRNISIL
jgi:hypothetical protein